ncbi:MAG: lytic transglycosylase domain-containing protein [Rhodocyclaceae bacterium]
MKPGIAAVLACLALAAHAGSPDDAVLKAREAFAAGNRSALARALEDVRGHTLEPWVEYWSLRQRLEEAQGSEIEAFLALNEGSLVAERLRADRLRLAAAHDQWEIFDREMPKLAQPDRELECHRVGRSLARGEPGAIEAARLAWEAAYELPASCDAAVSRLVAEGVLGPEELWQRMRRLLETRRVAAAVRVAARLPAGEAPDPKLLREIGENPGRYLRSRKAGFTTRRSREAVLYAIQRLAAADPRAAAAAFESLKARLSPAERGYAYGQLGWQAALRHLPEALPWYKAAGAVEMGDEQLAWKARAALRASDWRALREIVAQMPERLASQPAWIYWAGRAQAAAGRRAEAQALFERIAGQPHFYGNLASEELGREVVLPPRAAAPAPEEIAAAQASPGIARALALFRLGLRIEAVAEWNWSLRARDDRFLLAASELARREQLFDRAVNTADRTAEQHDYGLRYLAPFREYIEPQLRSLDLDDAWVYGLMRQESRFVMNARSSSGARGLMQLMPSTAKWVARRIGLRDFSLDQTESMNVNVMLGTNYLRMVLDGLENHPVLASAAYNAGPGRARRWRDARPIEGAIYAETIPIAETREYVKKVMSNSLYYDALFNGRPRSLKARLGTIPAANGELQ